MERFLSSRKSLLLISFVLGFVLWKLPLLTQDGANHRKVAVILDRLEQSPFENSEYQNNLSAFHTNELFEILYKIVSKHLSADHYEKLFFIFFILSLLSTYYGFLKAWDSTHASLWILILPFIYHPLLMRGLYNFLASISFTLLALIFLKEGIKSNKKIYLLPFFFSCWLAFLAHPFPFFVLLLVEILLWITKQGLLKVILPYSFITIIFMAWGFLLPFLNPENQVLQTPFYHYKLWELIGGLFVFNFTAYSILDLYWAGPFFIALVWMGIFSAWKSKWAQKCFWLCFLVLYFVFPKSGSSGGHINERFLIFMWMFLPLGLSLSQKAKKGITVLSILTFLVLSIHLFKGMQKAKTILEDAQNVYQLLPSQSRLYPINFDFYGPALNHATLTHLWANYPDDKQTLSPYLFAYNSLMPLSRKHLSTDFYFPHTSEDLPRQTLENANSEVRRQQYLKILESAFYYDYWFIHQAPMEFIQMLLETSDLEKIAQSHETSLWHYKNAKSFKNLSLVPQP